MDTQTQLPYRFYISIDTASTDTEISFFDLTGSAVTESFVKPLVVIIPFDIFKNREVNLLNTFEGAAMVQPFPFQFPQKLSQGALSQHSPLPLMLWVIPNLSNS